MEIAGICKQPLKRLRINDSEIAKKLGCHVNEVVHFRGIRNHEGWWRRTVDKDELGNYTVSVDWELQDV